MYFANPLGLLALLALPAIVVIHMYHRRFEPLYVAGAHLWGAITETQAPGRKRQRLPFTASLLLELLAALLIALLLSQPRFGEFDRVEHVVVVLDNSASMQAAPAGDPSFREAVLSDLQSRAEALGRNSRYTVILTGRRPVMLAGPAIQWSDVLPRLAEWKPAATAHDFELAWDLASQLAADSGRVVFYTDSLPPDDEPTPRNMELVSIGRPTQNVAITDARWTFDPAQSTGRVFLRVANLGRQTAECEVSGRTAQSDVFRRSLSLPAGSEVPLETEVPGGLGRLTVEAQAVGDGLSVDNTVTLIEPSVRMLTLAITLPTEDFAYDALQRVLRTMPGVQFGDAASAQLVFSPGGVLPESRPALWWFGVGPLDPSDAARQAAKDLAGPFLLEKRNPLLDGVALDGVIWGGVQSIAGSITPIISAANSLLLGRLNGTQATAYVCNIDLERSNLTESPDWPILIQNLIELRRSALPGLRRWNYRLNEDIQFRLFEGNADPAGESSAELTLVHGNSSRPLARTSVVELPPLDDTGVYELRDGERVIGQFAVNFHDPQESDLTDLSAGIRPPAEPQTATGFEIDNRYSWVWLLGIVLVLVVVLLDWRVLKRSV
jgi:hypothetical protein